MAARTRDLEIEKQKTEDQARRLLELDRAKSRFFANISHEFRTPLTLIIGPLQDTIQGMHDESPTDRNRQLNVVMRNARKLLRLINELLDLSRLESGRLELDLQPVEVVGLIREIKGSFAAAAERRGLTLVFSSNRPVVHCLLDAGKVEKIVSNLLGNAIKFTPAGGKIGVTVNRVADPPPGHVLVTIEDTGCGIPPEHLDRVFDRFEQVESSSDRPFQGSGIGLALARELTELHGGSIEVESRVNFGTTFTVRLPFEEVIEPSNGRNHESAGVGPRPDGVEASGVSTPASTDRILIVEDNAEVRAYLRKHLEAKYSVLEAENGVEGLEIAKSSSPDLILTDVMMPVMDGYRMVDALRSDEATLHVPVMMLTARADEGEAARALQSGADDYLAKPFAVDELLARISSLIERQRKMRERFSGELVISGTDIVIDSADSAFLEQVRDAVDAHLSDPEFGTDWLADEVALSRRQLERRLASILGESPAALIRRLRLERASQLLRARAGSVSEIAYSVGFSSAAYFTRAFRKHFGESPTTHAARAAQAGKETEGD